MNEIKRSDYQITTFVHCMLERHITAGDICLDATCGNGGDTLFLAELVGETGHVFAFDIQSEAIEATREKLEAAGLPARCTLFRTGHEHLRECLSPENLREHLLPEQWQEYVQRCSPGGNADHAKKPLAAAIFNFGYLPGGSHKIHTEPETSLAAIRQCEEMLAEGGVIALCIYSGGDTGYAEKDAILAHLRELDQKRWLVICADYYNRRNDPPLPAFIIRLPAK